MDWIVILILATVLVEAVIAGVYRWVQRNVPEQGIWVIMGTKVLKLVLAAVAIFTVYVLAEDIDIKRFGLCVVAAYLISLVFETTFFLKN